jgi:hypothetical protein
MYIATQELKKKAREPNWMNRQIFIITKLTVAMELHVPAAIKDINFTIGLLVRQEQLRTPGWDTTTTRLD